MTPSHQPNACPPEQPRPRVRVYAKRPKDRRWQLLGEFDTREQAWSAIVAVPRGFEVWLNDVPTERERLSPTPPAEAQADAAGLTALRQVVTTSLVSALPGKSGNHPGGDEREHHGTHEARPKDPPVRPQPGRTEAASGGRVRHVAAGVEDYDGVAGGVPGVDVRPPRPRPQEAPGRRAGHRRDVRAVGPVAVRAGPSTPRGTTMAVHLTLLRRFLAEHPEHVVAVKQGDVGGGEETLIELATMAAFADWCVRRGSAEPGRVKEFKTAVEERFPGHLTSFLGKRGRSKQPRGSQ